MVAVVRGRRRGKTDFAPALNTLVGDHKKMFEASYARMHEAIRALVKRAVKSGDIRKDLDPMGLTPELSTSRKLSLVPKRGTLAKDFPLDIRSF